ncbi:hypothetical protein Tcan_16445 [Toxocara canis]|uniref:Uncharacterized protein n=1 Tax=Toxocara canis TaxID=6265 RepID=A0A0B2W3S3_TOXCA|nr:hypothetical protein Tcan_16445 [Toxocara canis]
MLLLQCRSSFMVATAVTAIVYSSAFKEPNGMILASRLELSAVVRACIIMSTALFQLIVAFASLFLLAYSEEALLWPSLVRESEMKRNDPHWDNLGWAWGKRSANGVKPPQWENLGWTWGKRSIPSLESKAQRALRVAMIKKNPDWHDLGWTWGK